MLYTESFLPPILSQLLRLSFACHCLMFSPVNSSTCCPRLLPGYLSPKLLKIYASLSLAPWSGRFLDLTTASEILALTKPHIYEYSRFGLFLRSKARRCYAATSSIPGVLSMEYTIGVKLRLRSRQVWRSLYFFSSSAVSRDFVDVWRR